MLVLRKGKNVAYVCDCCIKFELIDKGYSYKEIFFDREFAIKKLKKEGWKEC